MMKCKKCGATLLMEQVPEVHISEAVVDCNQPGCDGKATYINNPSKQILNGGSSSMSEGEGRPKNGYILIAPNILVENKKDG